MFLKNIHAKNFRGFEDITVEFSEGINLLVGNNGSGKTSLIEAMALALGTGFALIHDVSTRYMEDDTVRYVYKKDGDATHSLQRQFPQYITCDLMWMDALITSIGMTRKGEASNTEISNYDLPKKLSLTLNNNNIKAPIFCLQNFDRDWHLAKNTQDINVTTGMTLRSDGYKECLTGKGNEETIQKWCLKMSFLEFQRKQEVHEYQLFQNTIKQFMSIMLETSDDVKIEYSVESSGMELTIGEHKDSIYNLSTGYRAILSMIMELAYRASVLNPTMQDFSELEGVVLIDEIDAHLHPKWQWKILDAIRQVFPRVQFIIATHSPIVISSVKDAHIIKLIDLKTTEVLEPAYGYTADDVLELRQGSTARPENIVKRMQALENAVDDGDFDKADKLLQDAKDEFGEASPIYNEMNRFIRVNRWVEESE